ncbi:unnamed protein product [Gadus morhua 'NCC']
MGGVGDTAKTPSTVYKSNCQEMCRAGVFPAATKSQFCLEASREASITTSQRTEKKRARPACTGCTFSRGQVHLQCTQEMQVDNKCTHEGDTVLGPQGQIRTKREGERAGMQYDIQLCSLA